MSLQPISTKLMAGARELSVAWEQTQRVWGDAKRDEFERLYVSELLSAVDDAVRTIGEIDKVLTRIRHDCE
jgi:hypothetical protein